MSEWERPVDSIEDLVEFVRSGEKPPERWRVGTEHEKIGLLAESFRPVPYEGERGIGERRARQRAQRHRAPLVCGHRLMSSSRRPSVPPCTTIAATIHLR